MPAGEAFTTRQREEIGRAVTSAEKEGNVAVSVYVGPLDGASPRARAQELHARVCHAPPAEYSLPSTPLGGASRSSPGPSCSAASTSAPALSRPCP